MSFHPELLDLSADSIGNPRLLGAFYVGHEAAQLLRLASHGIKPHSQRSHRPLGFDVARDVALHS